MSKTGKACGAAFSSVVTGEPVVVAPGSEMDSRDASGGVADASLAASMNGIAASLAESMTGIGVNYRGLDA